MPPYTWASERGQFTGVSGSPPELRFESSGDRARSDPPLPADGSCAWCGGERKSEHLRPLYRGPAESDPFCTTECARAWHGVPLPAGRPPPRRAYVSALPSGG